MIGLLLVSIGTSCGFAVNSVEPKAEPPVVGEKSSIQDKNISSEKKVDLVALEAIALQLKDIQNIIGAIKTADYETKFKKLEAEIFIIKDQITRMELAINKLAVTRSAASYTPPVPANATIKIANTSPVGASVIINGKVHKVAGLQTLAIPNQNVGDFNYEVMADGFGIIQQLSTRSVAANETFIINIYPR